MAKWLIKCYEAVGKWKLAMNSQLDKETVEMYTIELIDIGDDAGDRVHHRVGYIKLLDWLEATCRSYPIRIHSMNVVGRMNMIQIAKRNGWTILD